MAKKKSWQVMEWMTPIGETAQNGKEFIVKGTMISEETSRNGVKYLALELEKSAPSWIGKPILLDHEAKVENLVGRVRSSIYNPKTKSIKFSANIMDERVKKMMRQGLITDVSIGAMVGELAEEKVDGEVVKIARDIVGTELSLVAIPGIIGQGISDVSHALENSFMIKESLDKKEQLGDMRDVKPKEEPKAKVKPMDSDRIIDAKGTSTSMSVNYDKLPKGALPKLNRN